MPEHASIPPPWEDVETPLEEATPPPRRSPLPPPQQHVDQVPRQRTSNIPQAQTRREASRTQELLNRIEGKSSEFTRPEKGFRRLVYDLSNGRINPRLSKEEQVKLALVKQTTAPLPSDEVYVIAVLSQKGGIGKTTTTVGLGATVASNRTDNILAFDSNPDGGSLALRVPSTTKRTVLDLRDELRSRDLTPMEFDGFVNHNPKTRLDAIVMPPGEKSEHPLSADDFALIADSLHRKYPYRIVFVDCGTDLSSPVMDGIIPRVDLLVVVTTTIRDEAAVTMGGLDALAKEGYSDLVANSVTMMVNKQPRDPDVHVQREIERVTRETRAWFRETTRTVIDVPYDSRIRLGNVFDLDEISEDTRLAYLRGSAEIIGAIAELGK